MLIAPHPDDESIACSVILQRAVRAGAEVRIVYLTDGDNNPWPQRVLERKWRLTASDRKNWGGLRRKEALDALSVMGIRQSNARFLGLPDQGLTDLLMDDPETMIDLFSGLLIDWAPTHLLATSLGDTHPDHNAAAVMLQLALQKFGPDTPSPLVLSFVVHGKTGWSDGERMPLQQTAEETAIKRAAISCHQTQLILSKRRFLGYADRSESFSLALGAESLPSPIHVLSRTAIELKLEVPPRQRLGFRQKARLLVAGRGSSGDSVAVIHSLPVRSRRHNRSPSINVAIPIDRFSTGHGLFVKLDRRAIFFDEGGWLKLPPLARPTLRPAPISVDVEADAIAAH